MILELDSDFGVVDFSSVPHLYSGLETICLAVARGEHFLCANRVTIDRLVNDQNLTKVARGIFEWLRAEYSFLAGLFQQFSFRIKVKPDSSPPLKMARCEWSISISHIADVGIRPTVLLGENSRDGDLYIEAAAHYRLDSKLNGISVKIEPRNGNGGSTSSELERISVRRNEFCLCITDSDRFCPTADFGDIGSACRSVADKSDWVILHDAPASRELENAIPQRLVEEAAQWAKMPGWVGFSKASEKMGSDAILHSDVKHGTTIHWIRSMPPHSPNRKYWEGKFSINFGAPLNDFNCKNAQQCSSDSCRCVLVPAVGVELVQRVQEFMRLHGPHEILKRARGSDNLPEWLRLGRHVLEAGVAPPRKRL